MTYTYFVWVSVIGNAVGAFASLIAGLADRWGRANIVVYGLLVIGPAGAFGLPNAPNKASYLAAVRRGRLRRGDRPGGDPRADPGLLTAAGPGDGHGLLDDGPGRSAAWWSPRSPATPSTARPPGRTRSATPASATLVVFVVALFGAARAGPAHPRPDHGQPARPGAGRGPGQGVDPKALAQGSWRQMLRLDVIGSALRDQRLPAALLRRRRQLRRLLRHQLRLLASSGRTPWPTGTGRPTRSPWSSAGCSRTG